jgi:predicted RNA-binding Zn-ribbon protein involved in translation (DUF1610 family)
MVDFFDKPLTLGDAVERLGLGEGIMVEFPNGKHRYLTRYSRLDYTDASLRIDKSYKHDPASKIYHVKIAKYRPGSCDEMIEIKPAGNSYYGIDPIAHTKECDEYNPISQMRNIREWYGVLYDKYFKIKRIICDGPATIIFWNDGDKTVVKAQDDTNPISFDYEKGILYAALKKLATKKEYDNILRAIDKVDEGNPDLTNQCGIDHVEAEKPKKKVYKRHFGDSNQRCPYCGQNWIWTQNRRTSLYHNGVIDFTCKNCGRKIIYTKEGKYM